MSDRGLKRALPTDVAPEELLLLENDGESAPPPLLGASSSAASSEPGALEPPTYALLPPRPRPRDEAAASGGPMFKRHSDQRDVEPHAKRFRGGVGFRPSEHAGGGDEASAAAPRPAEPPSPAMLALEAAASELAAFWDRVTLRTDEELPAGIVAAYRAWCSSYRAAGQPAAGGGDAAGGGVGERVGPGGEGGGGLSADLLYYSERHDDELRSSAAFREYFLSWANPHLVQVFRQQEKYSYTLGGAGRGVALVRVLTPEFPREKYRRRAEELKTLLHWGQRKLLMSEIEFLTNHARLDADMWAVYAGAAPGTHVPLLRQLFPRVKWLLIDSAHFSCAEVRDEIEIIAESCSDALLEKVRQRVGDSEMLLISDIRSADFEALDTAETERRIREDMDMQMRFHKQLRPVASMFKFRLPWADGETEYLDGQIHLPVWGPLTTTETRLVVLRDAGLTNYDNRRYEEQLFYFNTVLRATAFPHNIRGLHGEGLDHCYDCAAEVAILSAYSQRFRPEDTAPAAWVATMVRTISHELSNGHRHLSHPNVDPRKRKEVFQRRPAAGGEQWRGRDDGWRGRARRGYRGGYGGYRGHGPDSERQGQGRRREPAVYDDI